MNRKTVVFLGLLFLTLFFSLYAIYSCTGYACFGAVNLSISEKAEHAASEQKGVLKYKFSHQELTREREVDLEGNDVLVYLHIQKTGGATFGRHLVHDLDVFPPCECTVGVKKCECFTRNNRIWLFSRHSVGWPCGLHADWTELTNCVERWFQENDVPSRKYRRYHFITFLRNPLERFLSEWQHVQRGATWASAKLRCNGRNASKEEVPKCYHGVDWKGVSFNDFISCPSNLAFNRMTRMLSNLSLVNCYNRTGLNDDFVATILENSARRNLMGFAFFGIVEEQEKTQFLFEKTFGIRFIDVFRQKERTHVARLDVTKDIEEVVLRLNKMDVKLYRYARELFFQRVAALEKKLGYTVEEYFDVYRDKEEDEEDSEDDIRHEKVRKDDDGAGHQIKNTVLHSNFHKMSDMDYDGVDEKGDDTEIFNFNDDDRENEKEKDQYPDRSSMVVKKILHTR